LHHHFRAVTIVLDHFLKSANLTLYPSQALLIAEFDIRIDGDRFASSVRCAAAAGDSG
jgi:hypothetical protein